MTNFKLRYLLFVPMFLVIAYFSWNFERKINYDYGYQGQASKQIELDYALANKQYEIEGVRLKIGHSTSLSKRELKFLPGNLLRHLLTARTVEIVLEQAT